MRQGAPFVGQSGEELTRMLHDAGILRSECFITNVFKLQPPGNDLSFFLDSRKGKALEKGLTPFRDRYIKPGLQEHISLLEREIRSVNPDVILALGNIALWATTGKYGIDNWRGSELGSIITRADGSPFKVLCTYHPTAILRVWSDRFIAVHDLRKVKRELDAGPALFKKPYTFHVRPSFSQVMGFLNTLLGRLAKEPVHFSMDEETRGGHIACMGIGISKYEAMCIPFMCIERREGYWTAEEELEIVLKLREVATHPNARVSGQNFIYDSQYSANEWGWVANLWRDTMLTHHVCFPNLPKGLDFLGSMYAEHYTFWKLDGKEWDPRTMPEDQLWSYNCEDCCYTWEVAEVLEETCRRMNTSWQVDFQHRLWPSVLRMMLRGADYDHNLQPILAKDMETALEDRLQYFQDILGHKFNPNSNKQMQALFYTDLQQKVIRHRKTKMPTLDDAALDEIAKREPILKPFIQGIREFRSARVFKSTFIEAQCGSDGKMRCSYNIAGTKTFRFSSSGDAFGSGMNLQNLSKGTEAVLAPIVKANGPMLVQDLARVSTLSHDKFFKALEAEEEAGVISVSGTGNDMKVFFRFMLPNVRRLFIPGEGWVMVDMDLDRADLQVAVWEWDDKEMKDVLRSGTDMHSVNAAALGCSRQMAKMFVHGTNYGGSARTMAINCGLTVHQSDTMQKRWFAAHPGIKDWHNRVTQSLYASRSVQNRFGFRCFFFDRIESIIPDALAWIPQSTVGNVINTALQQVDTRVSNEDVQIILQVHDSLTMRVRKDVLEPSLNAVRQNSLITIPYEEPLVIPVSFSLSHKSWGDVKPLKDVMPDFKFAA